MKVTITFESENRSKTFVSHKVLFLSDWLTVVDDATRSEFKDIQGIAAEHSGGLIAWSKEEEELPLW